MAYENQADIADQNEKPDEFLVLLDEDENLTEKTVSRTEAHEKGILHGASHIFIYRIKDDEVQFLLQRRSKNKDSFPGCLDISSAGHVSAGSDFISTAVKELREELGIDILSGALEYAFRQRVSHESFFYGKAFKNNEVDYVYLLKTDIETDSLVLQESEVEEAVWKSAEEILERLEQNDPEYCLDKEEFIRVLGIINGSMIRNSHENAKPH